MHFSGFRFRSCVSLLFFYHLSIRPLLIMTVQGVVFVFIIALALQIMVVYDLGFPGVETLIHGHSATSDMLWLITWEGVERNVIDD